MIAVRINIAQERGAKANVGSKSIGYQERRASKTKVQMMTTMGAGKADLDEQNKYIQRTWPKYGRKVSRREGKQCQIVQFEPTQCNNK